MVSKGCPIGTISRKGYNRKSYTKKSGKMIKATRVKRGCTKNMGMPGKTPAKKRVIKIPKDAEHLSKYGYKTSATKSKRLNALKKAVKKYGYASVIHKLSALRTLTKKSQPSKSKKYNTDIKGLQEWKMKNSGKKSVKKSKKIMKGGDWETNAYNNIQRKKINMNEYFKKNISNNSNIETKKELLNDYCNNLNMLRGIIHEMYFKFLTKDIKEYIIKRIEYNNTNSINNIKNFLDEQYNLLMNIYNDVKQQKKIINNQQYEEKQMRLANNEAKAAAEFKAIKNAKIAKAKAINNLNLISNISSIKNSIKLIQSELNNITNITSDKYLRLLASYSIKLVQFYNILLNNNKINDNPGLLTVLTDVSEEITTKFSKYRNSGKYVFPIKRGFIQSRKNICDDLYKKILNEII